MSSVDEVFRQMQTKQNEVSVLSDEETIDSNDYCMLESDTTRKILIPEKYSIFGVESDEYAKTVKFAFPRYVNDGKLDLSEYSIRINYMTANPDTENNKDQIQAKNVHVVDDYVVFEWELSRRVTQYRGTITFIVCAVTAESNGEITTEWNTTIATSQSIEGLEVSPNENEEEQARDLLTELLSIINVAKEEVIEASEQTQQNKTETENLYNLTRSYAVGDTGTREGEETDNSKYYYTKCKDISDSIPGALKPVGTVVFENLPELSTSSAGDMYNISNEFVTDERFKEGSGNIIPLGSNVYKTADGFWDVLTGSPVTGIKGENEQTYRRGNVNITKENIGLGNVSNVSTDNQTFTFTEAESDSELVSGEKASIIFGKLAKIVKTVISLKEDVNGLNGNNAGAHNSIYRGKNLGNTVTDAQWQAISSGTFVDLYVGDYWTIGGVNWHIAAFDYYYNCGDTNFTKHHVVIVPDTDLYTHVMNDTNITTGAYVGSKMYTEGLEQAKTTISNAFGSSHVLSHRIYLSNATSNGKASAGAWTDSTVDLMCEHMVYGSGIFSPVSDGSTVPNNYRVEKSQLPLFAHNPRMIGIRSTWWLRDVITSAHFAVVGYLGDANYSYASGARSVRPAFCIG